MEQEANESGAVAASESLARQTEVLLRMARSQAIDSGDLAAALREITEAAADGLDIERVGVWFYEDDTKDAMASPDLFFRSKGEHSTAPVLSHTAFPTYFAELAKERVLPAGDAHTHPGTAELSEAYLTPLGIGALLDAPIRHHGRMVGIVCHEHVGPARTWTRAEINFAGSMADAVARALASEERAKAEAALRDANRDLESRIAARTEELAASNQKLRQLHEQKDEMFRSVSHQLRAPLRLILTPVETMRARTDLDAEDRERLGSIQRNTLRLLGLVDDVLDLAKLEATAMQAQTAPVDVAALLTSLCDDVRRPAQDAGVSLRYLGPASGVVYSLDAEHVERIMLNLISNGLKFTPRGGRVDVQLVDSAGGLSLVVRDSGCGIAEEDLPHLFDRSRPSAKGEAASTGAGMGLALADKLVRLVDGEISVRSRPGRGSTFTVGFPDSRRSSVPAEHDAQGPTLSRKAALARFEADASEPDST